MLAIIVGPILYLLVFQRMQQDILAHERIEAELHRSEEQFRRLSQISPVGIFHADAQGSCTYVNERWCEITGLTIEESLGEGWMRALHPDDRENTLAMWQKAMSTRQSVHMEWRMSKPDGTVYWALGGATTEFDGQGNVLGFIGIVNDITSASVSKMSCASPPSPSSRRRGCWSPMRTASFCGSIRPSPD